MFEDVDDEASSCGGAKKKYRKGACRPRKKEPGSKKEKGSSASEDEIVYSARATNPSGKKRASRPTQKYGFVEEGFEGDNNQEQIHQQQQPLHQYQPQSAQQQQ